MMATETRSSAPLDKVVTVVRGASTKVWLRKNISKGTDEEGNEFYRADEENTVLEGVFSKEDIEQRFDSIWNDIQRKNGGLEALIEVIPSIIMKADLTDSEALSASAYFPEWTEGEFYKKGWIVSCKGELYRIGQDHTSQADWVPGSEETTALYSHISLTEEGYEVWKEFDGVSGSYSKGTVVKDPTDGKLYESLIDSNVWGPPSTQPSFWKIFE